MICKKKKYINLPHKKKNLYTKLTYYDNLNKNVEQPDLKITRICVQQK